MKNQIFFFFFLVLLISCGRNLVPLNYDTIKILPENTPIFSDPNIGIECENAVEVLKIKKKTRCRVVYNEASPKEIKVFLGDGDGDGDGIISNKDNFFVYCLNDDGYYQICLWSEHQDSVVYSSMSTSKKVSPKKFYKLTSGEGSRLFFDQKALKKKIVILEGDKNGIIRKKS
jgi:hypothetical protein